MRDTALDPAAVIERLKAARGTENGGSAIYDDEDAINDGLALLAAVTAERDALDAELKDAHAHCGRLDVAIEAQMARADVAEAERGALRQANANFEQSLIRAIGERDALRKALAFYADQRNYVPRPVSRLTNVDGDGGCIARALLTKEKTDAE